MSAAMNRSVSAGDALFSDRAFTWYRDYAPEDLSFSEEESLK
jgi:hypothetical protein